MVADGVSGAVPPVSSATLSGLSVKPVSAGGGVLTVTTTVACRELAVNPEPLPLAVTVIVEVPGATAVITPVLLTLATAAALLVYAYVTETALPPVTAEGVSVAVPPVISATTVGLTDSEVTAFGGGGGTTGVPPESPPHALISAISTTPVKHLRVKPPICAARNVNEFVARMVW